MTDELSGEELDRALALAMGWRHEPYAWFDERGDCRTVPRWHESVDALLRDVWPVAQARGSRVSVHIGGILGPVVRIFDGNRVIDKAGSPDDQPALVFARALLAMLTEVKA